MYIIERSNGQQVGTAIADADEACRYAEERALRTLAELFVTDTATGQLIAAFDGWHIASGAGLND